MQAHACRPLCAAGCSPAAGLRLPLPAQPRRRAVRVQVQCPAVVQCSQHGTQPSHTVKQQDQREQDSLVMLGLKAVMMVTAASAAAACFPQAAHAEWRPRRHLHEGLRGKFVTQEPTQQAAARKAAAKQQAAKARAEAEQQAAAAGNGLQRMLASAQRSVKSWWHKEPVYSVGISNRTQAYSSGRAPSASPYGWVPLLLAGGLAFTLMLRDRIQLPGWMLGGGRGGQGGRWVRDRSLGGKMVFIPDAELPAGGKKQARSLWGDFDDDTDLSASDSDTGAAAAHATSSSDTDGASSNVVARSSSRSSSRSSGKAKSKAGTPGSSAGPAAPTTPAPPPPSWWNEPSYLVYAAAGRKAELQKAARGALRELEDGKLLKGLDYSVSGLVQLRTLCQEAGGYQVKPRTESGRDAMLRAGVRAAISAATEGRNTLLGGDEPTRFVCGLAHDLGVPQRRAITIVHAEVAAVCRQALIDAEAAYRAGDQSGILMALVRLAGTLQTFPLPAGSAEAELVSFGIVKQTTLEFRKAVFFEFGAVSLPLAALVAEMLGFDPELVMPQLEAQHGAAA